MSLRRVKPLPRLLGAAVARAGPLSWLLLALGTLGALCLPLASKKIFFDENALNIGSSHAYIKESHALTAAQQLRHSFLEAARNGSALTVAHAAMERLLLDTTQQPADVMPAATPPPQQHRSAAVLSPAGCARTHGVLRAPRGDGKEALVLVTPLGAADASGESAHGALRQSPEGAALALAAVHAVMGYLSQVPWLARDVIWVVTDTRCGCHAAMEAWIAEYQAPAKGVLHTRRFPRGGLLQQAIILEAAGGSFDAVLMSLVGAAGQLPKLDLFYLLRYYAEWHVGIPVVLREEALLAEGAWARRLPTGVQIYAAQLETLVRFGAQQAAGQPTGPHAAFKRYGVDAVTVRLVTARGKGVAVRSPEAAVADVALVLELALRSLNGLLEKFHHSYTLYALVSTDRFLTVELYIIPLICLILVLPLQAAAMRRRMDSGAQMQDIQAEASPGLGSWTAAVLVAAAINTACVVAFTAARAESFVGSLGSMYQQIEITADQLSGAALWWLPPWLWGHAQMGASGSRAILLAAVAGVAGFALLTYLAALVAYHLQRTPGLHSKLGRVAFWRQVFVLICTMTTSELSALACINWAAAYAAALILVPLSTVTYRVLL